MTVDYPLVPFHLQILEKCREHGDAIALTDEDGDHSFLKIYELSHRFASYLSSHEFYQGNTLLVMLPNSAWYPIVFLGGALIGCCLCGIDQESSSEEVEYYAKKSGANAVICEPKDVSKVENIFPAEKILLLCSSRDGREYPESPRLPRDLPAWEAKLPETLPKIDIELDDPVLKPFSSGTGGLPRCVLLTHRNYSAATAVLKKALFDKLLSESCRKTVAVLPFYHASGFWALLYCLLEGCHTIIMKAFHPVTMLEIIQKHEVDTLNVVPSILSFLCRVDTERFNLSSLRTVLCGSSPLGKELSKTFLERFPSVKNLIQGYGMTEVVVLSHINPLGLLDEKRLGSCGKLLPGFEAMLKDENGSIIDAPHRSGELYLKSPTVMLGYFNTDENAFVDDWIRTGDVLYYDEDGFYYVVDRVKDLIKVNGVQVSPSQLEDVILTHPSVKEVGVIGIAHSESGQVPKAFVVLHDGVDEQLARVSIRALVAEKVAPAKHLRGGVEVCKELPKTSSGKIKRSELRKRFAS
ncbi:hypothetical protein Aduo_009498 [Ancylostoma duodenale]